MYLSGEIFSWPYDHQSRRFASGNYVSRAREIWRHARDRLSGQAVDLDRTDCMTSLKRTINHRLKALEAEYAISTLPTTRTKKQALETLQDYGLVRPSLLAELMKVRNDIEHNDTPPPDLRTCYMYVDVVWYFLKSTDQLLDMVIVDIVYDNPETNSALTLEFQTASTWQVKVSGIVRPDLLRESQRKGDLEILDYTRSPRSTDKDIRFSGIVNLEPGAFLRLAHDYFGVQGYAYEDSGV
jgi:hypothetical protein